MENVFEMPIFEQLFKYRKEDIEQAVFDENEECKKHEDSVCDAYDNINKLLQELIPEEDKLEKLKELFGKLDSAFEDRLYFWSNFYYKLGINDMHKLKNELKAGNKSINKGDTFLDYTDAELDEYIQSKVDFNSDNYKAYKEKCRELERNYPRVLKVFEDSTPIVLNKEEMVKLMEIKELDARVRSEEVKVCFKAGINEVLNF